MLPIPNFESRIHRWKRKLLNSIYYFQDHTKILLYHRVKNLLHDPLQLAVHPDNFYEQLKTLQKKYYFISIDELFDALLKKKKIKGKTILVTFDDGYVDNFTYALPILETLQIPAAFFITTSHLNTDNELWWDELGRMILQTEQLPEKISLIPSNAQDSKMVLSSLNKEILFNTIHDHLKFADFLSRNKMLASLRKQINNTINRNTDNRLMNFDELKKMSQSNIVTIGAHTVNHVSLSVQQIDNQHNEIDEGKNVLEKLIQKPVKFFAYPYGTTKDFNNNTVQLLIKSSFQLAFVNYYGFVTKKTHPYKIPRILVRNWSAQQLEKNINKFF